MLHRELYQESELAIPRREALREWYRAKCGLLDAIQVHDDFPHWVGGINVAGIEDPFYYIPSLAELLPRLVLSLLNSTGWGGAQLELARLHVADRFNYQGFWHRDAPACGMQESIVVIVYLMNEGGFRILPQAHACNGKLGDQLQADHARDRIAGEYVVDAKVGDVFMFRSALLHRGYVTTRRMHLHLRFRRGSSYNVGQWQEWRSLVKHCYRANGAHRQHRDFARYLMPRVGYSSIWQAA